MFKRIVVIVDGSEAGADAVDVAVMLAREDRADVVFCASVDPNLENNGLGHSVMSEMANDGGQYELDLALHRARSAGFTHATGQVLTAGPATGVADFARTHAAGLITLGVRPRAGMLRPFVASMAEELLRETTIPLCVVRRPWPRPRSVERRILVPIVDDELAHIGIDYAIALARNFRARLIFCSIVDPIGDLAVTHALARAQAASAAAGIASDAVRLSGGNGVAQAIVERADILACDCIVIATHAREGWPRFIEGSVTAGVFYASDVPVVIVRAPFGEPEHRA